MSLYMAELTRLATTPDVVRTVSPIVDPVTVGDTKDYLRITESGHDTLLGTLIAAATVILEDCYGMGFLASTFRQSQNLSPRTVQLLRYPVLSVASVKYITDDTADTEVTLASTEYSVQRQRVWARTVWPSHRGFQSFIVYFKVGFGDPGTNSGDTAAIATARALVPENIKKAIMQLTGHMYENPEGQGGEVRYESQLKAYGDLPMMVQRLMSPYLRKNGVF